MPRAIVHQIDIPTNLVTSETYFRV